MKGDGEALSVWTARGYGSAMNCAVGRLKAADLLVWRK